MVTSTFGAPGPGLRLDSKPPFALFAPGSNRFGSRHCDADETSDDLGFRVFRVSALTLGQSRRGMWFEV